MRTRSIFRYLIAIIIALGTTVNAMAQQRNLKIYFNQYTEGATGDPIMLVTDDNNAYDLPAGVTVSAQGVAWAKDARFFEWISQDVNDRLLADYLRDENGNYYTDEKGNIYKKESHMKLKFTNFPYEVNMIQWNKMNDLFSGFSLSDLIMNYNIATKCVPFSGNSSDGFSSSEEHWALNVFTHNASFSKKDIPWQDGKTLNGLTSFEINEGYDAKIGLGRFTFIDLGKKELSNKCRTFIKAGWNGDEENPNITDSDDSNWSFKVKFTLPEIRMTGYACNFVNGNVKLGQPDNYIYKGEKVVHALRGYISAHAGAVEPTYDPADIDGFHFEYFADDNQMTIVQNTGLIKEAKVAGDIPVTVVLMRGPKREVCRYVQKIRVYEKVINATSPEICIGFVDGKKGYDLTLTEKNAQIKGFITKYGKDQKNNDVIINPIENAGGYHFEYSESSNGKIITIDPITGNITPKAEGDVTITAVLKDGNTVISNPYSYTLHVFGKYEGVNVTKNEGLHSTNELKYHYSTNNTFWGFDVNPDNWKASETNQSNYQSYDWQHNSYLRPSTTIQENSASANQSGAGTDGWKEFAWYKTTSANYWRGIAQKIGFDIKIPKYSTMEVKYSFAGNVNIGAGKGTNVQYGFEVIDLGNYKNDGVKEIEKSNAAFNGITWKTNSTGENVTSASKKIAQKAIQSNGGYVGDGISNIDWSYTDSVKNDFGTNRYYTHYLAVMAYLYRDGSYPGEFSVGYKGIPTYTYYTKVTYAKNDGKGTIVRPEPEKWVKTTSKTETFKLFQGASNSEKAQLSSRAGYTFLGWSTDPNATTPEYELEDDFPIYDNVNGGGKGHVTLYAVWKPNKYIVELRHVPDGRIDDYVEATYDQAMPSVNVNGTPIVVPVQWGYDFKGYYAEGMGSGTKYYNEDLSSNHIWDRTEENYVIAKWDVHKSTVVFDLQGGQLYYGATEIIATYNQDMPIEGLEAPHREGYTFGGYYNNPNGAGTQYYTASMTSARKWDIDERLLNPQVAKVTLYAKWIANTYTVTLDPQGGTGGSTSVIATYGEPLPSGEIAPTKPGYEFKGYYSNENQEYAESIGQNYGGTQYYDEDMNGVEPWDKAGNTTIYAHWAPATYVVTFDAGSATLPQGIIDGNKDLAIEQASDGLIKIRFTYGATVNNIIDNSKPKKPAYQLLGFYDENDVLVATVSVDNPDDRHIHLTGAGNYWEQNGTNVKWVHDGDLTLTAKYERKFTVVDGNMIKFGSDAKVEYVEPKHDWLMAVVNDLVGAAQEVGSKENPVMVFDMTDSKNIWTGGGYNCQEVMESLQASEYSDIISPNVLVYFNEGSYNNKNYETNQFASNAITADNKCLNLYVTDRYQMKIPYAFDAAKALYERNKYQIDTDDPMWVQSHESMWGTLCLPYPVKNNNTHTVRNISGKDVVDCKVIFYELRKKSGNVMQFYKLPEDAVIPANTPILYERKVGVSSAVTIEERSDINDENVATINIPANPNYAAETKFYDRSVLNSAYDWQFIGNMQERTFYGKNHSKKFEDLLSGEEKETSDNIYYFKKDNFTRMGDKNYMILYPYRAYFREVGGANSNAKVGSYSILVVDEEGATDITNEIFGDGEGDGKIYDLNGIRVMKPVKGRLYIVNGQKKVYK